MSPAAAWLIVAGVVIVLLVVLIIWMLTRAKQNCLMVSRLSPDDRDTFLKLQRQSMQKETQFAAARAE